MVIVFKRYLKKSNKIQERVKIPLIIESHFKILNAYSQSTEFFWGKKCQYIMVNITLVVAYGLVWKGPFQIKGEGVWSQIGSITTKLPGIRLWLHTKTTHGRTWCIIVSQFQGQCIFIRENIQDITAWDQVIGRSEPIALGHWAPYITF